MIYSKQLDSRIMFAMPNAVKLKSLSWVNSVLRVTAVIALNIPCQKCMDVAIRHGRR